MIVFLVSGLWHGAEWTYVLWGGIHGLYQIVGDLLRPVKKKINASLHVKDEAASYKLGQMFITFILTTFAWIFFRADSIKAAKAFLVRMFTRYDWWSLHDGSLYNFGIDRTDYHIIIFAVLLLIVVDILRYVYKKDFGALMMEQNIWFRWVVLVVLIVSTVIYGAYGINYNSAQFIYFQF